MENTGHVLLFGQYTTKRGTWKRREDKTTFSKQKSAVSVRKQLNFEGMSKKFQL